MGTCISKPHLPESYSIVVETQEPDFPNFVLHPQQDQSKAVRLFADSRLAPSPLNPSIPISYQDTVLGRPFEDIKAHYALGRKLGKGLSGIVYVCTEKCTGKLYACKSMLKRKFVGDDKEDVRREIRILQHLSGQANIVEFKGAYEDRQSVHIVMELCAGGELFGWIKNRSKYYNEKEAATMLRAIVNIVHRCHSMGVMHRDLKPENFLLSSKDEGAVLKATDFGLSVFIEKGRVYHDIVGSCYYVAPEVLLRSYGKEIDIWSAGVILYILLSGVPPFCAQTEEEIFCAILKQEVDLEDDPWPDISASAKDLVRKMLTKDPKKRITAAQVLAHPWFREASKEPKTNVVALRMKEFRSMSKVSSGARISLKDWASHN